MGRYTWTNEQTKLDLNVSGGVCADGPESCWLEIKLLVCVTQARQVEGEGSDKVTQLISFLASLFYPLIDSFRSLLPFSLFLLVSCLTQFGEWPWLSMGCNTSTRTRNTVLQWGSNIKSASFTRYHKQANTNVEFPALFTRNMYTYFCRFRWPNL